MNDKLLGKWYAKDASRYYQIIGKPISYYKLYVTKVDGDKFWYDSFIQMEDGTVQALKVDKESLVATLIEEIQLGALSRDKNVNWMDKLEAGLPDIGRKYGLDIKMVVS